MSTSKIEGKYDQRERLMPFEIKSIIKSATIGVRGVNKPTSDFGFAHNRDELPVYNLPVPTNKKVPKSKTTREFLRRFGVCLAWWEGCVVFMDVKSTVLFVSLLRIANALPSLKLLFLPLFHQAF